MVIPPCPSSHNSSRLPSTCPTSLPSQPSYRFSSGAQVVLAPDSPKSSYSPPVAALPRGIPPEPEAQGLSLLTLHNMMTDIKKDVTNIIRTLEEFRSIIEILHILRPAIAPTTAEILALKRLRTAHPRSFAEVIPIFPHTPIVVSYLWVSLLLILLYAVTIHICAYLRSPESRR